MTSFFVRRLPGGIDGVETAKVDAVVTSVVGSCVLISVVRRGVVGALEVVSAPVVMADVDPLMVVNVVGNSDVVAAGVV